MSSIIASSRPPAGAVDAPATGRGVLSSSHQPHRLGQPAGGVDGEHDDPPAPLGRAQGQRGGRRGLADAARAAADDHPGAGVVEQAVDVERRGLARRRARRRGGGRRRHATPCSTRRSARSYSAPRSMPPAQRGQLGDRPPERREVDALLPLELRPAGRGRCPRRAGRRRAGRARHPGRAELRARPPSPAASRPATHERRGRAGPPRRARGRAAASTGSRTMLTQHAAQRQADAPAARRRRPASPGRASPRARSPGAPPSAGCAAAT